MASLWRRISPFVRSLQREGTPRIRVLGRHRRDQEVPEEIDRDEVKCRISMLFNLAGRLSIWDQQWAFSVGSLPPMVRIFCDGHLIILVGRFIHLCC
jgi:hypothetical protein